MSEKVTMSGVELTLSEPADVDKNGNEIPFRIIR